MLDCKIYDVLRSNHICFYGFKRVVFAEGYMLQCGSMKTDVNALKSKIHPIFGAHVSNQKSKTCVLGQLMLKFVLFMLIAAVDANHRCLRLEELTHYLSANRAGAASYDNHFALEKFFR